MYDGYTLLRGVIHMKSLTRKVHPRSHSNIYKLGNKEKKYWIKYHRHT